MLSVLFILLLSLWTGYGLFRVAGPRRFQSDLLAGLFLFSLLGVLLIGWIALIVAELGFFSAWAILFAGALIGLLGCLIGTHRKVCLEWEGVGIWRGEGLFIAVLLVLMGVLYFRPHEFIWGGADAGVYVNLGASIACTGRWLIHNADLAVLPLDTYPMFFREHPPYLLPRYNYLPGFYVSDSGAGTIIPQFYPLHPVWLALAYGIGGIWADLYMTPLWGMLGVLAFYFAVREAFDQRLAAAAATILALTPTQVWFSRYPTAEVLTQFLLFGGLWAFAWYARRGENRVAVLAGLALGQVMLARVDTYFLLGLLPLYAAYLHLQNRLNRRFLLFAIPLLAMGIHSFLHGILLGWPYLYNTYSAGRALTPRVAIASGVGVFLLTVSFVLGRAIVQWAGGMARVERLWRILLSVGAIGLVLLAAFAYFLRPLQADPSRAGFYWYGEHTIPDVEPFNMVRLGWYLSRPGLALGVLGIAAILGKRVNERTWMIVGVGVFFSLLFLYRTFNNPHHVYVMRRYVPAVIPTFALGMAYAALWLANWRAIGRVLATGLTVALVLLMVYKGKVLIPQVDYKGGVDQFRGLTNLIPQDAVVLFNDDEPVGAAGVFGTPLAFLEGRTVLDLREDRLDFNRLDALVEHWQAAGQPVIVVNGSSPVSGLCDRWNCQLLGKVRFDLRVLEHSYDHWPTAIVPYRPNLMVYVVENVR